MNERPALLDFREICERVLDRVFRECKLTPEEMAGLCAVALTLSVDMENFGVQSMLFLRDHKRIEVCEEALHRFRVYLMDALSDEKSSFIKIATEVQ